MSEHEERIIFREWEFVVDKARTREAYDSVEGGSPDGCTCTPCKNFIANRESAYPAEIKQLLSDLGADYKKEAEISHFGKLDNGLHYYIGWFHIKGRFIGRNSALAPGDGGGLLQIDDRFKIGFYYDKLATFFKDPDDLVQIEFEAYIPWTIAEPESE